MSSDLGGYTVPTVGSHDYAANSLVTGITAYAEAGYTFTGWLLDGSPRFENPIEVLMDADHTLHAQFTGAPPPIQYTLTVLSSVGRGSTSIAPGTWPYNENTVATNTAYPAEGAIFKCWLLDGAEDTRNPIDVLMNMNHTLQAVFKDVTPVPPTPADLTPVFFAAGIEAAGVAATIGLTWLGSILGS